MRRLNNKYGLVLAGGGSKGAYQIGAWKALRELGIKIEAVVGVSIGSVNGALIAMDDYENAMNFWSSISIDKGVRIEAELPDPDNLFAAKNWGTIFREVLKKGGLDASPAKDFFNSFIDEKKVRKSKTDLGLITINLTKGAVVSIFKKDIPKGQLVDYLLASADVPLAINVGPNGERFLDGGAYDNTPITFMRQNGYNKLVVVDIANIKGMAHSPKTNNSEIVYIRPHNLDDLGASFDFSPEMNEIRLMLGYLDTMKAFSQYLGNIYYFEPEVFRAMIKKHGAETVAQLEELAYRLEMSFSKVRSEEEFLFELKELYEADKATKKEKKQKDQRPAPEPAPLPTEDETRKSRLNELFGRIVSLINDDEDDPPAPAPEDDGEQKKGGSLSSVFDILKAKKKSETDLDLARDFLDRLKLQ